MPAERWQPMETYELIGLSATVQAVKAWLTGWKHGSALLLHGPPGCGKSATVAATAHELGQDIIRIEDIDGIRSIIGATTQTTLSGRRRLVVVEDVDAILIENRKNSAELLAAIRKSRWPMVLTTIDPWEPSLKSLRPCCTLVAMKGLATATIASKLKQVAEAKKVLINPQLIQAAATIAAGDMRAGLNCLEMLAAGADGSELVALDKTRNPFELLAAVFKGTNLSAVRQAVEEADIDLDTIFSWLETNIFIEWQQPEQVADALELLSRADVMRRHHQQTSKDMLTSFALLKGARGWTKYSVPDKVAMAKQLRAVMAQREEVASDLAPLLHCSKAKVRSEYLPFLRTN